jgi:prepilin-type N-terminal cleavage/methylation domain-containing protein
MKRNSLQRGFTLIEMIVSVALFSFVMTIAATAYLNLISLERQTRANNDLNTNLSFVTDTMTRAIRTGGKYQCGGSGGSNCPLSPSTVFTFVTSDTPSQTITYKLDSYAIDECIDSQPCVAVTDPRIVVNALNFYVSGVGSGDSIQPQVVIVIHGSVRADSRHITDFSLQTSATQRVIEL